MAITPNNRITSADVINAFNTLVRDAAPSISAAPWYSGNFPNNSGNSELGPRTEVVHTAAEVGALGAVLSVTVFNLLHGFAMELTRVRATEAWHRTDGAPVYDGSQLTALNTGFALYFQIPTVTGMPGSGFVITSAAMNTFLSQLSSAVNSRRTSTAYLHTIVSCHTSCHGNCHGSRGRR